MAYDMAETARPPLLANVAYRRGWLAVVRVALVPRIRLSAV